MRPAFPVQSERPEAFDSEHNLPLPNDYRLEKCDVVNGRGKKSLSRVGNRRFRLMAALNLKRYYTGKSKAQKKATVIELFRAMRDASPGSGGFLKDDPTRDSAWLAVGGKETREIIGSCMSNMITLMRESDDNSVKEKYAILTEEGTCRWPLSPSAAIEIEMTTEQRTILRRLEAGFTGPVDRLLGKAK